MYVCSFYLIHARLLISCFCLKIKASYYSEILVNLYQTVWRHIREDSFISFHARANPIRVSQNSLWYLWFSFLRQKWFLFETESELIQAKYIRRFNIRKSDGFSFPYSEAQLVCQRQALTIWLWNERNWISWRWCGWEQLGCVVTSERHGNLWHRVLYIHCILCAWNSVPLKPRVLDRTSSYSVP